MGRLRLSYGGMYTILWIQTPPSVLSDGKLSKPVPVFCYLTPTSPTPATSASPSQSLGQSLKLR